jgi:hypothetical protein
MFENQEIEIPCKNCNRKHKKTIGWIRSHNGGSISCGCGKTLVIESRQFDQQIKDMEKQLNNLFKK